MRNLPDLTRWNRAGLERFRYIDGNAITYLETVREKLAESFAEWPDVHPEIPSDETATETEARLKAQYFGPRRDWAWEIARSFVRANHILTEHMNAFANEGYLNTATQWEYLRRLVDMLDYSPRPPGSASTIMALIAKSDVMPGLVKRGVQTDHTPDDGRDNLVFESLEDIEVDPLMNGMHLVGWNHNPRGFDPFGPLADQTWVFPEKHDISTGQAAVLLQGSAARAVDIAAHDETHLSLTYVDNNAAKPAYILGDTVLLSEPDNIYICGLNGPNVFPVSGADEFTAGQVIAIKNAVGQIGFARIKSADRFGIKLTGMQPPNMVIDTDTIKILKVVTISQAQFKAAGEWRMSHKDDRDSANLHVIGSNANGRLNNNLTTNPVLQPGGDTGDADDFSHDTIKGVAGHDLHVVDMDDLSVIAEVSASSNLQKLIFEGGPGQIVSGDYFVAEDSLETRTAIRAIKLRERENNFMLELEAAPTGLVDVVRIFGPFKQRLHPKGFDRNPRPIIGETLQLDLDITALPQALTTGRSVIVEPEIVAVATPAFSAVITDITLTGAGGAVLPYARIALDMPPGSLDSYAIGDVIIRGNAVKFGHGETKPYTVLGSGDASKTGQKFTLEKENVSFVADNTLEAGVRAEIEIIIDDRRYLEVSTLANSEAVDAHYETRMTEDGFVKITFGDGRHGRRLSSGRNNINIGYRVGTGRDGNNVAPFKFEKMVKPHALLDGLRQPLVPSGGQDVESIDQIRTNAPSHLKALGRGVSLSDFEHIAKTTPGIWHAKAFHIPTRFSRQTQIEVSVVPVDNAPLGELKASLESRLSELSPPHMAFTVTAFDPVPLVLDISLQVNSSAYDPIKVEVAVRTAIFEALSLEHRKPGERLFVSQIYKIVEAVTGVENSKARFFDGRPDPILSEAGEELAQVSRDGAGVIMALRPTDRQVIYVTAGSAISILIEEASI